MWKKWIFVLCSIILMSICIFGIIRFSYYKEVNAELKGNIDYIVQMGKSDEIIGASFFISPDNHTANIVCESVYFGDYIVYSDKHYRYIDILFGKQDTNPYIKQEIMNFVNIETSEIYRSLNVNSLFTEQGEGMSLGIETRPVIIDGNEILVVKDSFFDDVNGYLYYYFDSGKVVEKLNGTEIEDTLSWEDYFKDLYQERSQEVSFNLYLLTNERFLEANGLANTLYVTHCHNYFDGMPMFIKLSDVPLSEKIKKTFPDLYQYKVLHPGSDYYVSFIIPFNVTAEEVVELLINDEQEVSYEGVVLSGDLAIDGKEHTINCFEDYLMYIDHDKTHLFKYGMM